MKKTALYEEHTKLGASLVDFGGWFMPLRYSGDIAEHEAARTRAGLFDVSHMGEIWVEGLEAEAFLDFAATARVKGLEDGQCLYSPLCREDGGIVDDILVYRFSARRFLLVVNASNTEADFDWLLSLGRDYPAAPSIKNVSPEWSQLALQGPLSKRILQTVASASLDSLGYYRFAAAKVAGVDCLVSRTGYTGEAGFEIYCPWAKGPFLWEVLLDAGKADGILPCGLGARDSLRFEACLPLYGHELGADVSPLEAGLERWVKLGETDGDFVGKAALLAQKERGVPRRLRGIEVLEPGIARQGCEIFSEGGSKIGVVTSGTFSPSLKKAVAMALVDSSVPAGGEAGTPKGDQVKVVVRGRGLRARFCPLPFYRSRARSGFAG